MYTEAADRQPEPIADLLVGALKARFHELVDLMCAAVQAKSAAYASLRDEAGFRTSIARTVGSYAESLRRGGRLPDEALTTLHVAGAERCRQGVPEQEMLDAVRWAAQVGAEFLIRAIADRHADAKAVTEAASLVATSTMEFVSGVQAALSTGWRTEEAHRLPAGARAQATLVDRLLEGGWRDAELSDLARAEGVGLSEPCLPLVVTAGAWDGGSDLRAAAEELATSQPEVLDGAMRGSPVAHVAIVAGRATAERVPAILEAAESSAQAHRVLIVVGALAERLEDASTAYRQATAHLEFAGVERRWPGLLGADRLRVYGMLAGLPLEERIDLCLSVLGPVLQQRPPKRDELLVAYEAFGEAGGSQVRAAKLLGPGVNAHTVKYRIGRLEHLTKLRCDVDGDRLLLGLAVRAYRAWVADAFGDEFLAARQPPAARSSSVTRLQTAR